MNLEYDLQLERDRKLQADIAYAFGLHFGARVSGQFDEGADHLDVGTEYLMEVIRRYASLEREAGRREVKAAYMQSMAAEAKSAARPDENCYTLADGQCVNTGKPCMHQWTPDDWAKWQETVRSTHQNYVQSRIDQKTEPQ